MIVSDLKHIEEQIPASSRFSKAIHFLKTGNLLNLADGKIAIDGESVFAIVQRYETIETEKPKFECHRKYIDVQFIASGEETIGWAPANGMTVTEPYDRGADICFGTVAENTWTPVKLQAGQLAVLRPEDAHAPKIATRGASSVMKIVVKIAAGT